MKKRLLRLALPLCCALLLTGCMSSPPDALLREAGEGQRLISASTADLKPESRKIALYFRYEDSAYLAPERREIQVRPNESLEKAVAAALIQGPGASAATLSPLFPPGTEVMAAAVQGNTLFITFNEAFLGRYADESSEAASGAWREEGTLRRTLCLQSLAATLTEAGLCAQVQVLVYPSDAQAASMRLQAGYLTRSGDTAPLPPVTRDESRLLTPHNAARLILASWQAQDWAVLYDLTVREGENARPGERNAIDAFAAAPALADFELSPGTVSLDGQAAALTVSLTLLDRGTEETRTGWPLLLNREEGVWKMEYARLLAMMNGE